jgi:hypothetical protein
MYKTVVLITISILANFNLYAKRIYLAPPNNINSSIIISGYKIKKNCDVMQDRILLKAGDTVLLKSGENYKGKFYLKDLHGTEKKPILITTYGDPVKRAKISGSGFLSSVIIENSSFINVKNLEITSNGKNAKEKQAKKHRFGIYVKKSNHINIEHLYIHDIYASKKKKSNGKYGFFYHGNGIQVISSYNINIYNTLIEEVGLYGMKFTKTNNVTIKMNHTRYTGGSGLQVSKGKNYLIKDNVFEYSGSLKDPRMKGRGSGSWVWLSENILYTHNIFAHARGKADSCGIHIDWGNRNVIVEDSFSIDNEGGFVEILGDSENTMYRYNVSIGDGCREKGLNGSKQDGKLIWLSGFRGKKKSHKGPDFSYIYNNTVYIRKNCKPVIKIEQTAKRYVIANNIFYVGDRVRKDIKSSDGLISNNNFSTKRHHNTFEILLNNKNYLDLMSFKKISDKYKDFMDRNIAFKGISIHPFNDDIFWNIFPWPKARDIMGNQVKVDPGIGAIRSNDL